MNKKIKYIITVVLTLCFSVNTFAATSISDLQKQKADSASKIKAAQEAIKEKTNIKNDLSEQIKDLDIKMMSIGNELEKITQQLDELIKTLDQTQIDLKIATDKRDEQEVILQRRLIYIYEYGQVSYFQTIISATSFSDFLKRLDYIKMIADYDQNIYAQLQESKDLVDSKIKELAEQKIAVETAQREQIQKKDELQHEIDNKNSIIEQMTKDISVYQKQEDDEEKSSQNIEKLIKAEQAKQASSGSPFANTKYTGGKFLWPTPGHYSITSYFGPRVNPVTHIKGIHSGIDISTPTGSSVVAGADGTIIFAGWQSGYGYVVIIQHGGGINSVYAHNSSLKVKVGQSVKKGSLIAKSGSTGWSTGPHVHFEIRVNGKATNPIPYLK